MGRRSKVLGLPADVKTWLDAALVEGNFSQYEALAEALKGKGYAISKSALHRYGEPFQLMMSKVKIAGEQAQALMAEAGDDKGAMNDALIRMVQQKTFEVLMSESDEPGEDGIAPPSLATDPKFVRAIATLVRASVTQKEWASKVKGVLDVEMDKARASVEAGGDAMTVLETIQAAYRGAL